MSFTFFQMGPLETGFHSFFLSKISYYMAACPFLFPISYLLPRSDFILFLFQALNLILLTSSELSELRDLLKQSLVNPAGKDLFVSLYASWCHSPMAIISLCLLAQVITETYFWRSLLFPLSPSYPCAMYTCLPMATYSSFG